MEMPLPTDPALPCAGSPDASLNAILDRHARRPESLLQILRDIQEEWNHVPAEAAVCVAAALDIPLARLNGVVGFYSFLSDVPLGRYRILFSDNVTDRMLGSREMLRALCGKLWLEPGRVSEDGLVSVDTTSCTGMCDQGPALLVNGRAVTRLTHQRVNEIAELIRAEAPLADWPAEYFRVEDNVRRADRLLNEAMPPGEAIAAARRLGPEGVIGELERSGLRGRGGAGFPTARKWTACRAAGGRQKVVVCNADEGEPGTFKDRVLLTRQAELLVEGMSVCALAVGATLGFLYLRGEYRYLLDALNAVLTGRRATGLLGNDFDIRVHLGAGAYVCGEESALIESMEGKRGEPRNRPPFPVQKGYLDMPTVINNVETLSAIVKILVKGPEWFKAIGTRESSGTKLLSISGDCRQPGIYEVEWGTTIRELLEMAGATSVQAVQMGGPSGVCINPSQFHRAVAFEDLATGGSVIIIGKHRDLLREVVVNFMDFFIEESCSSCAPCRSLTVILRNKLQKILDGKGSTTDIKELHQWTKYMKIANRCGLGQTAANPVLSTIENFRHLYEDLVIQQEEFVSTFDLGHAVADSCEYVGRIPKLEHH
jgi:[NiFe] hydrogenase diaphorase moiety large subunit